MKIFVAVGTHPKSFKRLIKAVDELIETKKIKAEVFGQIGSTVKDFAPKNFSFKELLTPKGLAQKIKQADLVIAHGGAGIIINTLKERKPLIIAPRLKKFDEHTDNHQLELCLALEKQGQATCLQDTNQIMQTIETALKKSKKTSQTKNTIGQEIDAFLKEKRLI